MFLAIAIAFMLTVEAVSPTIPAQVIIPYVPPVRIYVDRFYKYKALYRNDKDRNRRSVPISVVNIHGGNVGECYYGFGLHYIHIDEKFWEKASEANREELIFHELGHCDLDRDHQEDKMYWANRMISKTIMHCCGFIEDKDYWSAHEYYMEELFSNSCTVKKLK